MKMPQTATKQYISQERRLFHCNIKVKVPAAYSDDLLELCFAHLEHFDRIYNSYQPGSYFDRINKNSGSAIETDEIVSHMLTTCKEISRITNGAYDITAMPLIELWGFYNEGKTEVPGKNEIANTLRNVSSEKIYIEGNTARINNGQEIISGSFAKAFAVDVLKGFLKSEGIDDAIINAGGSTISDISNAESNWTVNIPHPFTEHKNMAAIRLENSSFSLSGSLHNYITINAKRYSHVINAKTGFPSENAQAGVLCKSAFMSDVLSTAIFALHENDFDTVVQELKAYYDFEAYLVTQSSTIKTTGYEPFKSLSL